jgi:hypothetical protein
MVAFVFRVKLLSYFVCCFESSLWITNPTKTLPVLFPFDRLFCSVLLPFLVRFFGVGHEIIVLSRDRRKVFIFK